MSHTSERQDRLLAQLAEYSSCVVAFSGGVDSAVVAQAAWLALGDRALAVTGVSPSLAASEREIARRTALQIGIPHREIPTLEFTQEAYLRNDAERCYHCKTELYGHLEALLATGEWNVIVNGANLDDLDDYRPGMRAAKEHAVRSPLAECGLTKRDVRELAAAWGLPVWDKPASPCLSSRVAYGEKVTPERLARIEAAETWLHESGFRDVRVRLHPGELARVEVPLDDLARLLDPAFREQVERRLRELGFAFVTVDLRGLRSGSLNQLIQLPLPAPAKT